MIDDVLRTRQNACELLDRPVAEFMDTAMQAGTEDIKDLCKNYTFASGKVWDGEWVDDEFVGEKDS